MKSESKSKSGTEKLGVLAICFGMAAVFVLTMGLTGRPHYQITVGPDQNLHQVVRDVPLGAKATITCLPGHYTIGVSNLWYKPEVSFHFMGCDLEYQGSVLDHGSGIFDDRFVFGGGGVTSLITGALTLLYCPGTNVHWDDVCSATGHTNARGAIVVTNANSSIRWLADTRIGIYGPAPFPSALHVRDCASNSVFHIGQVYNGHPGNSNSITLTNCPGDPGTQTLITTGAYPLYWVLGTMHVYGQRWDNLGGLAVQAYGSNSTDRAELFLHLDWLDGKIYAVGRAATWKIWMDILEWQATDSQNGNAFNAYGAGSHYIRAQKISSKAGAVLRLETPGGITDTNLTLWVDIQKVSQSNGWVHVSHGALRGRIGQFEQNGPSDGTPGIFVTNISAFVSLNGENMAAANTAVHHGGGRTELSGYHIHSTNRDPVLLTGAGFRPKGITLLVGTGATNSIRADSAQNVANLGLLVTKSNAHANVTFTVGASNVVVDPDVD